MQEQNFEKQVREKMEELSFTPSEPVWQKVEEAIQNKKDKRRILFWLWPLCVLIAGGALWYMVSNHSFHKNSSLTQSNLPIKAKEKPIATNRDSKNGINNISGFNSAEENNTVAETSIENKKRAYRLKFKKTTSSFSNITSVYKRNDVAETEEDVKHITQAKKASAPQFIVDTIATNNISFAAINELVQIAAQYYHAGALQLNPVAEPMANIIAPKNAANKKWLLAPHVALGIAGASSHLFDLGGAKAMDVYIAAPQSNTASYNPPPSPITKGWSLAASVDIKRSISKRTSLFTGLQYHYFSTHLYVGQKVRDSTGGLFAQSIANYYRNNNRIINYQNQYHFIELPIGIEVQLLKKHSLNIGTGFSVAQLIYSNALHYNYNTQLYYQDNSLLNKTQLHWFAYSTYNVWNNKKFALQVGPQVDFGLSGLNKGNASSAGHLFAAGITVHISLK